MGMAEHQAAAAQAEAKFQAALGPANLQNNSGIPQAGGIPVSVSQSVATQAAIAKYRALRQSAIANGISPAPYISALQDLGTGGV